MFKVSVIVPVYDNPDELRKTLEALTNQTMPPESFEVLAVDDGSSLDMKAVLEEYDGRLSFRYFYQEKRGFRPGMARNMGIRAADGELCLFLDCGVIPLQNCLEEHFALYRANGEASVIIGYIYGNDTHSDLNEMREIIDHRAPDESAKVMTEKGMIESRENLYGEFGDSLSEWPAPWVALWSLHFAVPTRFLIDNEIYFDEYFTTWGCEDNDFGIQLQQAGGIYVLGRSARAIHYPAEVRSYDRLKRDPNFHDNFHRNQEYVVAKYPDNRAVRLWNEEGYRKVNRILLNEKGQGADS
jgi:glycosyltransferase involved in cell wall biosynthesis